VVAVAPCRHCAGAGFVPREFGGEVEFGAEMDPCVCQRNAPKSATQARCTDCGEFGENRGHMTCMYPSHV
jgi:hypothetical protein